MTAPQDHSAQQATAATGTAPGQIGFCLPGSIAVRRTRCGKPRCACTAVPARPCIQWTRTVKGKTVTRRPTRAQQETYAARFGNTRRLRALATQLEPSPCRRWPGRRLGQDHPRQHGAGPHPSSCRPRNNPKHPKRREISPLNAGSAPRKALEPLVSKFCRWPLANAASAPHPPGVITAAGAGSRSSVTPVVCSSGVRWRIGRGVRRVPVSLAATIWSGSGSGRDDLLICSKILRCCAVRCSLADAAGGWVAAGGGPGPRGQLPLGVCRVFFPAWLSADI